MNLYKNIKLSLGILAIVFVVSSCDDGFEELNQNPNASPIILSGQLLAYTQNGIAAHRYEAWRSNMLHAGVNSNQMVTAWSTPPYVTSDGWITPYWDRMYVREVSNIREALYIIENNADISDETRLGKAAIARIWKVFIFHRITDFWGDIPYSEAGIGHREDGTVNPSYDRQEAIYADMLNELTESVGNLTAGGNSFGDSDILYGGDHDAWIAFGNSLRMRLGMRLTNVNPGLAQSNVEDAIAGGVISSNAGIARIPFYASDAAEDITAGQWTTDSNGSGTAANAFLGGSMLSADFVNILQDNADPRLPVYAMVQGDGIYVGLPNGYPTTAPVAPAGGYSIPNHDTVFAMNADAVMLSYAETALLLAEAAERGWNVSGAGSAQVLYEQGVNASLDQYGLGDAGVYVGSVNIAYNTAGSQADRLDQIATQKWLALFGDEHEAWADLRRTSGGPGLNMFTQVNGAIPNRVNYPISEQTLNSDAYTAAVAVQGTDVETTSIYWSK